MRKPKKIIIGILLLYLFSFQSIAQSLSTVEPEDVGILSARLNQVKAVIQEAIDRGIIPGAVILVARKGNIVMREALGESQLIPEKSPMTTSVIFDLASLTKPIATAASVMILIEQGRLRLWDKVKNYIPGFIPYMDKNGKAGKDAHIWHLLTHTSGLPSYTDAAKVEKEYGSPCPLDSLIKHISQLKKSDPPGEAFHYSCLGFITLAYIVREITGQTIDKFSREHIFNPLRMKNTFFTPPKECIHLCVPTEVIDGKPLRGIVHDPLARLLSGISGNAGLFSTADDLAIFAQMMLNKGKFREAQILSPLTVKRMTSVFPEAEFSGRGLGWDLHSAYATVGGDIFGPNSYGHSGYTGTSIWIDPETETFIILLTNRVHPNDKGSIVSLRSRVANIVASSIHKE